MSNLSVVTERATGNEKLLAPATIFRLKSMQRELLSLTDS